MKKQFIIIISVLTVLAMSSCRQSYYCAAYWDAPQYKYNNNKHRPSVVASGPYRTSYVRR